MLRATRRLVLLVGVVVLIPAGVALVAEAQSSLDRGAPGAVTHRPIGPLPSVPGKLLPPIPRGPLAAPSVARTLRTGPAALPDVANRAALEAADCPADALAWGLPVVCGYVPVPLDWSRPGELGTIRIYFELYTGTHSGPAVSAILQNYGGPGSSTTANRWLAFYFFGENLDDHDLLLIDDRGRGLSTTIDCYDLQHGVGTFAQEEAACAAQLGLGASRYGTGEIARDTDAVRAALGYDKVDYFGWSYGGADIEAYATRFGRHLRSIVADAPVGSPVLEALEFDRARTRGDRRLVRLDCQRSPTCSLDHPFPEAELDLLVQSIRHHPVEGEALDAYGNPTHVRIDEEGLLNFLVDNPAANFVNTGELLAAGAALRRGDARPLLRLGAERHWTLESDYGDATVFSNGAAVATACVDYDQGWDWASPVWLRQAQYAHAIAALPPWFFFPFSKKAVTGELYDFFGRQCLWWEVPTPPSPIAPPHARYPHVPTLVLSGDIDQRVPLEVTSQVARLYPDSTFVKVAGAGHPSLVWSSCAVKLASEFIRTLKVERTVCDASTPDVVWPAVGRFPRFAREARPASVDGSGGNEVGIGERRVVTVAVAAATDALQRATVGFGATGVGLRGGTFDADYGDSTTWTLTLRGCAFAEDVLVSGTVEYHPGPPAWLGTTGDGSFEADLEIAGSGTGGGTLHVEGKWQAQGPVGEFKVTGTLGGRNVSALVPEA
jgi:pimeloyl-ACP methyl ester carboxylesterase